MTTVLRQRLLAPVVILAIALTSLFFASPVAANYDLCGVYVGSSAWCYDGMTIQDNLAYATNEMDDLFDAPDPYHIHFTMTSWSPRVYRGAPIYTNYWITDNFNGGTIIYQNSDYNGRYLNDFSNISIGTNVTAGYYPQPYGSPTTTLEIRNADPQNCAAQPWNCATYGQSSQFNVN